MGLLEQGKSTAELAGWCRSRSYCKGFQSNGWLKSFLPTSTYWGAGEPGPCSGLFVKDGAVFDGERGCALATPASLLTSSWMEGSLLCGIHQPACIDWKHVFLCDSYQCCHLLSI